MVLNSKFQLRQSIIHQRTQLQPQFLISKSSQISQSLWNYLQAQTRFTTVLGFISFKNEPDLNPLYKLILSQSKLELCFPKITKSQMKFTKVSSLEKFEIGSFGIKEPIGNSLETEFNDPKVLILVPAVGIFKNGFRLGFGGGYYDSFLNSNPNSITIGVVYHQFYFPEFKLPQQHNSDRAIDLVSTEKGVFSFS